jgi:hypothetical protein
LLVAGGARSVFFKTRRLPVDRPQVPAPRSPGESTRRMCAYGSSSRSASPSSFFLVLALLAGWLFDQVVWGATLLLPFAVFALSLLRFIAQCWGYAARRRGGLGKKWPVLLGYRGLQRPPDGGWGRKNAPRPSRQWAGI